MGTIRKVIPWVILGLVLVAAVLLLSIPGERAGNAIGSSRPIILPCEVPTDWTPGDNPWDTEVAFLGKAIMRIPDHAPPLKMGYDEDILDEAIETSCPPVWENSEMGETRFGVMGHLLEAELPPAGKALNQTRGGYCCQVSPGRAAPYNTCARLQFTVFLKGIHEIRLEPLGGLGGPICPQCKQDGEISSCFYSGEAFTQVNLESPPEDGLFKVWEESVEMLAGETKYVTLTVINDGDFQTIGDRAPLTYIEAHFSGPNMGLHAKAEDLGDWAQDEGEYEAIVTGDTLWGLEVGAKLIHSHGQNGRCPVPEEDEFNVAGVVIVSWCN